MTSNDEWVRERVERFLTDAWAVGSLQQRDVATAALQEAIDRTRAEERANATQALRLAHEMQDKAVAAERERCAKIAESVSGVLPGGNWDYGVNMPGKIARAIRARTTEGQENSDG